MKIITLVAAPGDARVVAYPQGSLPVSKYFAALAWQRLFGLEGSFGKKVKLPVF